MFGPRCIRHGGLVSVTPRFGGSCADGRDRPGHDEEYGLGHDGGKVLAAKNFLSVLPCAAFRSWWAPDRSFPPADRTPPPTMSRPAVRGRCRPGPAAPRRPGRVAIRVA